MRQSHLRYLESEAIHIIREVAANFSRPAILYSIGKDSSVLVHLAMKAFFPSKPPFPLLHVDTQWKFREMIEFRDRTADHLGLELIVHVNREGVEQGINPFKDGANTYTHVMKTLALRQALDKYGFDAALAGARRDEEKSRSKERIFSVRSAQHAWDPKRQRPEMWRTYNTRLGSGETMRVFPLSNWTEIDIWHYIQMEKIQVVPLYFAARRPTVQRGDLIIMVDDERMPLRPDDQISHSMVRFRTLGCYPLTGALRSRARNVPEILAEIAATRTSERQGRLIDQDEAGALEMKKREGYF
ncbi:sulfate adenylyltransferase subunit CysD [Rhizobium mesoamericanum]|uniref:sulfate adenylyltransferase subunit CysD n=1 Tax=Rhizobium mesoamericanum TaxID=1079800 RepID=UPI0027D8F3C4|nr:sulfate adenylyltransferase subunit CysD [Rhizobium mesoamericanum]